MNLVIVNGIEIDLDDNGLVYRWQWGPREGILREIFIELYNMGPDESIYFAGELSGFEPEIWNELKEKYPTAQEYSTWKLKNA